MPCKVVTKNFDRPDSHTLKVYRDGGGYETLRQVLASLTPTDVMEEIKRSNLRGRGGAGCPQGGVRGVGGAGGRGDGVEAGVGAGGE